MLYKFMHLLTDEGGQGLTEYGLVIGVIAVGVVGIVFGLKQEIYNIYDRNVRFIEQTARSAGLLD